MSWPSWGGSWGDAWGVAWGYVVETFRRLVRPGEKTETLTNPNVDAAPQDEVRAGDFAAAKADSVALEVTARPASVEISAAAQTFVSVRLASVDVSVIPSESAEATP